MKTRVPLVWMAVSAVAISLLYLFALEQIPVHGQGPEGAAVPSNGLASLEDSVKQATSKITVGDPITYTVLISNAGSSMLFNTTLVDPIPQGTEYVTQSVDCDIGTCWYSPGENAVRWSGMLPAGTYTPISFTVDYVGGVCGRTITNTATISDLVEPFKTKVDAVSHVVGSLHYLWDFENGDSGGFVTHPQSDWEWNYVTRYGPSFAHSGQYLWGTKVQENYTDTLVSTLTKTLTLPNDPNGLYLQWWEWYEIEECCDFGKVYVNDVEQHEARGTSGDWLHQVVDISAYAGQAVTITFVFDADYSVNYAGWYIDDVAIHGGCPSYPNLEGSFKQATSKVTPGETITYTILINNSGTGPAMNATLDDPIPPGTQYVQGSIDCDSGWCWYDPTEDAVYWSGVVTEGFYVPVEFAVEVTDGVCGETITNTATISDPVEPFETKVEAVTHVVDTLYYLWDFENGDAGGFVTHLQSDWQWDYVFYGPSFAHGGEYVWGTILDGNYTPGRTSTLTKTLTLPDDPNGLYLQWWDWYDIELDWDNGWVYVNGFLQRWLSGSSSGWRHRVVDLSPFAGEEVTINFVLESDEIIAFAGWYIDDVAIHGGCLSPPSMTVEGPSLDAKLCPDSTTAIAFDICNEGGQPLSWSIKEKATEVAATGPTTSPAGRTTHDGLADIPWLSVKPSSGTTQPNDCTEVKAKFNATGLAPGDYSAALSLQSNDPQASEVPLPVDMLVMVPVEINSVTYITKDLTVTFDSNAAGSKPVTRLWSFGDGTTSDLKDPTHTYQQDGCYTTVFTATNTCDTDSWTKEICVTGGGPLRIYLPLVVRSH